MQTLIFDMYGVIIKESLGNLVPFAQEYFPELSRETVYSYYRKAQLGRLTSAQFFTYLGFSDPEAVQAAYVAQLTLDDGFARAAQLLRKNFRFALLSNDVAEWSDALCGLHRLDALFPVRVVSGRVGCRKPEPAIFQIALDRLETSPEDCIFIDNSVKNLMTAKDMGMLPVLFNRDGESYEGLAVDTFEELTGLLSSFGHELMSGIADPSRQNIPGGKS